jgi:hypothetical protein|tara:strand:- start:249 stop:461 length:213 start_codon:yes stop_codon:yes gene_type:complete
MKIDIPLRIVGSVFVITAYFIILHVNVTTGAIVNLIGDSISLPFFIRTKSWDVVVMLIFLMTIGFYKLIL